MRSTPAIDAAAGLEKLASYPFHIATWVDEAGYPVSVAVHASVHPETLTATFDHRYVDGYRHPDVHADAD